MSFNSVAQNDTFRFVNRLKHKSNERSFLNMENLTGQNVLINFL